MDKPKHYITEAEIRELNSKMGPEIVEFIRKEVEPHSSACDAGIFCIDGMVVRAIEDPRSMTDEQISGLAICLWKMMERCMRLEQAGPNPLAALMQSLGIVGSVQVIDLTKGPPTDDDVEKIRKSIGEAFERGTTYVKNPKPGTEH